MRVAIDASRGFLDKKTGIEEYVYQLVKNLRKDLADQEVVLYLRKDSLGKAQKVLKIPENWEFKEIPFKYFWTQIGMAWEFLTNSPDVLFVPAHTIPWIHPKNSVVTIHGLEYEHCPESYSLYSRWFHRFFIKKSCKWASKIVAISENTKKDLIDLYGVDGRKIKVVYNGFTEISKGFKAGKKRKKNYLLFLGRIEQRKNVKRIVQAYDALRNSGKYKGQLILAGKTGYGFGEINQTIKESKFYKDIILKGYVGDQERFSLIKNADIFLFPSLCEGFGLPILEAQAVNTPVITSKQGPMDEVAGNNDILVDPLKIDDMVKVISRILDKPDLRKRIVEKGLKNVGRFSWGKCGKETAEILLNFQKNLKETRYKDARYKQYSN